MKALVFKSKGGVEVQDRTRPALADRSDAIIRVTKTTICGTDLHIRNGDVETCRPGTVLGHEGVGIVDEVGESVRNFKKGDRVLISCITCCAACDYCRRGMYSHCEDGGWMLGHRIDGTQAEYVRIPHADTSLHNIPSGVDESIAVMLSDAFPTALECGILNGKVTPGSTLAIVGAGPVGLAAVITAQLFSPSNIIVIDRNSSRLEASRTIGANHTIDISYENPVERVKDLTEGKGCDAVIEAVGQPDSFELCQELLAPGGILANIGVHGTKASIFLDELWAKNITITTRLVDTVSIPVLLKLIQSGQIKPSRLITHTHKFTDIEHAYDIFSQAAQHSALKLLIEF